MCQTLDQRFKRRGAFTVESEYQSYRFIRVSRVSPRYQERSHAEWPNSAKPIVGVVTFCNMNLGYGLLAISSSHQVSAIELEYRMIDSPNRTLMSPELTSRPSHEEDVREAQNLLLAERIDLDRLIASVRAAGNHSESGKLTHKLPEHSRPIQTVSPDHLRVLGEITSQIQKQTQAVRAASQDIEHRLDLEIEEFQRQLRLLQECSHHIAEIKKSRTRGRAEKLAEAQAKLGQRMDRILAAMSAEYKPEIGELERKWFDELERLKGRIRGGGSQRGRGLAGHVRLVGFSKVTRIAY